MARENFRRIGREYHEARRRCNVQNVIFAQRIFKNVEKNRLPPAFTARVSSARLKFGNYSMRAITRGSREWAYRIEEGFIRRFALLLRFRTLRKCLIGISRWPGETAASKVASARVYGKSISLIGASARRGSAARIGIEWGNLAAAHAAAWPSSPRSRAPLCQPIGVFRTAFLENQNLSARPPAKSKCGNHRDAHLAPRRSNNRMRQA